jgi:hypothetical protein
MTERKHNRISKSKLVPFVLILMMALGTVTIGIIGITSAVSIQISKIGFQPTTDYRYSPLERSITWDTQLNFTEPGGASDYVVIGEAPDARDGPPADSYDVAKPPAPMAPYIRSYLKDNLPTPYTLLWKDYRQYPDTQKTFNLTIHWEPEDGESPTTITIVWSKNKLNASEYDKVVLYNSSGIQVPNMLTTTSFSFTAKAGDNKFYLNCTVDLKKPQIINFSPASGTTGDSYTFNASIFDDLTPKSGLTVKVNWAQGSNSGNVTMDSVGGTYFEKTVTLDQYSTGALTYHFYAKDKAKVPNTNYTSAYTATVADNDAPTINTITGDTSGTTGETTTVSVTFSDNIGVTVATLYYKAASAGSYSSTSILSGSAGISIPVNSVESWRYYVTVNDAALTGPVGNPSTDGSVYYTVAVSDNDAPLIPSVTATPPRQLINQYVNITATVTDNINVNTVKININGPAGFTPVNTSMFYVVSNIYYNNEMYMLPGIYTYYIWSKDTSNNGVRSSNYQFEMFAELQITALKTGWNFVSLPFNLTTPKTNFFIMDGGVRHTWGLAVSELIVYNYITDWNRVSQEYGSGMITGLTPGDGYWIYSYHDCELWATNLTPMITNDFITHLKTGWNIVGVPISSQISKANLHINNGITDLTWADAVTNGYVMNSIFGWQRTTPYVYFEAYNLDPGYSYWLYAFQDCTLKQ